MSEHNLLCPCLLIIYEQPPHILQFKGLSKLLTSVETLLIDLGFGHAVQVAMIWQILVITKNWLSVF